MNEEIIENIEDFIWHNEWIKNCVDNAELDIYIRKKQFLAIKGLLDLYNKQKEEIESLNNQLDFIGEQNKYIEELEKKLKKQIDDNMLSDTFIERDYISRDRIKEKIKYWKKERYIAGEHLVVKVLKELLEGE